MDHAPPSREHWLLSLELPPSNVKLADELATTPIGPLVIVGGGGGSISVVNTRDAQPALPAASVAQTVTVLGPSTGFGTNHGDEHVVAGAALYSQVTFAIGDASDIENAIHTGSITIAPATGVSIVTVGGVVSTTKEAQAGVGSLRYWVAARTQIVWSPSSSGSDGAAGGSHDTAGASSQAQVNEAPATSDVKSTAGD